MIFLSQEGFSEKNTGHENYMILQSAINKTGDIYIDEPGIYDIDDTVVFSDNTTLVFCNGAALRRQKTKEETSYLFINKGAYTGEYNRNIKIIGMNLICNDVEIDKITPESKKSILGLNAQLAFSYIKNLYISGFQTYDLGTGNFAVQVCSFENFVIENFRIEGKKDGIHLGRGNKFVIRHGIFKTFDDPIALNAHDYAISNPQMGWIEDGIIEDCYDLDDDDTTGFFCRILAGSWIKWEEGMKVQNSDIVEYENKLYRVYMEPDEEIYTTVTPPCHESGLKEYDGIIWSAMQKADTCNCGCRNIHFKDIFLKKKRPIAFSVHFDKDKYSRSYYPNSTPPVQDNIIFENIHIQNDIPVFLHTRTPIRTIRLINSELDSSKFIFENIKTEGMNYGICDVVMSNVVFKGEIDKLIDAEEGYNINVNITGSIYPEGFETCLMGVALVKSCDLPSEVVSDNSGFRPLMKR